MKKNNSEDNIMSDLINVISKGFNVSKDELEKIIDEYKINFSDKSEKSSCDNKKSKEEKTNNSVSDVNTEYKNKHFHNNDMFSKCSSFNYPFRQSCENEMFDILDNCVFEMNTGAYKNSIVIFEYSDISMVFKWSSSNDVYCLIYADKCKTNEDENVLAERIMNANLDFKDYNNNVISYYDHYSRSMKKVNSSAVVKLKDGYSKNDDSLNQLLNKVDVSNDITSKSIYAKCNKIRTDECIKYLPKLYECLDNIFKYNSYSTFSDKVSAINKITFPVNLLYIKAENGTSPVLLYKIYTAAELECIIKKRYQFKSVKIIRNSDDQPLEKAEIECKMSDLI